MAENNIQEGDEVSWKWGTSEPTGSVAEVKTDGKLEIETKGKLVHKNADPSNPAVHVARTGNDVVKRASELTKLDSVTESDTTASGEGTGSQATGAAEEQPKKRGRAKSNAAALVGEKREADGQEPEGDGKEADKETKKAKTSKADNGGEKKGRGRPRKDSKAKQQQQQGEEKHAEGEVAEGVQVDVGDDATKKKGRGGRAKKSDASEHAPVVIDEAAPAAHTRSKD